MTQVTGKIRAGWVAAALLCVGDRLVHGQPDSVRATAAAKQSVVSAAHPAEALYLRLRSTGLDAARTFHIRGASLDRSALHVTLEDGEISFTTAVNGHITGAFFEGEGEVLLTPPNQVERASMALFTGMAIFEERFRTGYLRFNDETFAELQPYLRPVEDAREFSARWDQTTRNLSELDALRLLASFSRSLPVARASSVANPGAESESTDDRMLHARLQGQKLATFDVYFDSTASEQFWAGQPRTVDGVTYYDLWTSFALKERAPESVPKADDVAISRYRIRAEVKPPTTLSATASIQVDVRRGGSRTLFFELSRYLQVKQVDLDGHPVEFINNPAIDGTQLARRGNDLVAVVFPEQLRTGQKVELRFVYAGDVLSEAGGGLLYVGARGTWYPNRGMTMSDFDLEFRYPPGWTLVATGKRVEAEVESLVSDGRASASAQDQVARWVTERPSTLAGFNLGRYERASSRAGDVTVEAYAAQAMERNFPHAAGEVVSVPDLRVPHTKQEPIVREPLAPSPARNAQAVADNAARAVEFFSQRFGPYPYGSLELTQMPGQMSQGWPGLVFLSSFAFLSPQEATALNLNPLQTTFSRLALPHEIAHQWWGDLVGWRGYRDQWIVEALANYCALMMLETEKPTEFRRVLEKYRADLLEKNKRDEVLRDAGPVTLGQRLNSSHFPNGYEAISYGRGTWIFHMLRHMLRDADSKRNTRSADLKPGSSEPFVRALRKLRERYAGQAISTQELFAVFEEDLPPPLRYEGRKSLDWFVQGWVQGIALPHLSLQGVKYAPKANGTAVSGIILEKEAPQDLVTAVPVYGSLGGKSILLGTVFADGPETPFQLTGPPGTKKVSLDPNQTLLTSPK